LSKKHWLSCPDNIETSINTLTMKRRWNFALWGGFLLVLVGLISYPAFFVWFPKTRDWPWLNVLICLAGGILIVSGLQRAFRQPKIYRGRVLGSLLALLSLAGFGFFLFGTLYLARQLPAGESAPRVGQKAPEFTLPDQDGQMVALGKLLASARTGGTDLPKPEGALLIFYRGHW
jgi:hypothetical protein